MIEWTLCFPVYSRGTFLLGELGQGCVHVLHVITELLSINLAELLPETGGRSDEGEHCRIESQTSLRHLLVLSGIKNQFHITLLFSYSSTNSLRQVTV